MKKFLFLLLAVIPCLAQNTFQPGYFIDNNGNRTDCMIRNIAWKDSPVDFEYKTGETAPTQEGLINDISEFSVANTYKFERFTGDVDLSSNDIGYMSLKKEPEWIKGTMFLKVLVQGDATLYEYTKGNIVRFFVTANGTTQQLIYKPYKVHTSIGYNNTFRGQLYEIMKMKLNDQKRFTNLRYDKDALTKLFLVYNGQQEDQATDYTVKQNKTQFNVKITAGANMANASIMREFSNGENTMEFDDKAIFAAGLEAELIFPFNNRKWSLFANPNYQSYKNTGTTAFAPLTQHWEISYSFIEIPIGIRHYMYLNDRSRIFINAAYATVLTVGDNSASFNYDGGHAPDILLKAEPSKASNFVIGGGFSYDRYSLEVRYNAKREIIVNRSYWGSEYSSIGVIAAYRIF